MHCEEVGKTISTISHSLCSVISLISFFPLHMIYINGLYQSPVYDREKKETFSAALRHC